MTTTDFPRITLPPVASRLRNGAWVLAAKHARFHDQAVVLGFHSGAGAVQPFCVWKLSLNGDAFWGDYHETLDEAMDAFATRR